MRGCEADRCDAGATVDGRWCERHVPADERPVRPVVIEYDENGGPFVAPVVGQDATPAVTPGYALEAPYDWGPEWADAERYVAECGQRLRTARQIRSELLARMRRDGMSLGDIAKVTGLTRQRIGQLLKDMP